MELGLAFIHSSLMLPLRADLIDLDDLIWPAAPDPITKQMYKHLGSLVEAQIVADEKNSLPKNDSRQAIRQYVKRSIYGM